MGNLYNGGGVGQFDLPALVEANKLSKYNIQINGLRLSLPCDSLFMDKAVYEYVFDATSQGLLTTPEVRGNVKLPLSSILVSIQELHAGYRHWSVDMSVSIITKSESSMSQHAWSSDDDARMCVFQGLSKDLSRYINEPDYSFPESEDELSVYHFSYGRWIFIEFGFFETRDCFLLELSPVLVLMVNFDASSCWERKGYAPEPVKQHLMKFYLDYLSHVKIIPVGSVPDSELPPLGFYPAEREEKAIDAEGRVVESKPDSDSSETTMGW